jgi:hypothetical protein
MAQMERPSKNIPTLTNVNKIFVGVLKYCPRLIKSQKIPEIPKVNQEANRDEIRAKRSLKLGILQSSEFLARFLRLGDLPLCNDPSNDPQSECNQGPTTGGEKRTLAHVLGAAEDADVDILGRDMAIDHTGNYNLERISRCSLKSMGRSDRWDSNAISNFGYQFSCGTKSGR